MSEWTGRVDTVGGRGAGMKQPDQFWAVLGVADGWTRDAGRVSEERSGRSACVGLLKRCEQIRESRGSAERRGRPGPDCPMQERCGSGKQLGFPQEARATCHHRALRCCVSPSGVGRSPTCLQSAGVPQGRLARAISILPVFKRETGSEKYFSTIRMVRAQLGWQTIAHGPSQPTACFCK